jgi:streptomycin 6-kinase
MVITESNLRQSEELLRVLLKGGVNLAAAMERGNDVSKELSGHVLLY